MAALAVLLCVTLGIIHCVEPFGPKMGPYEIELEKFEHCENQGSGKVTFGTRITKAGRGKYLYKENFTLGVPIDDHFSEYWEIQKWGNGGWRPKDIEYTFKNCEDLWKIISDFIKNLMKSAGVTVNQCPIPAGSYKADWLVQLNIEKTVPMLEYGKYRGHLSFRYKKDLVGCITIYGEAKPKAFG